MSDVAGRSRSERLDRALHALLSQTPEIEAAAVVSFDGLPMASALPSSMDEDRVAAMSAALLSLGERAAQGLGRGELSQVYIEGDNGTVFLVSADEEAVLVAVAAKGAKVGMMLFEVRRAAATVADVLRADDAPAAAVPLQPATPEPVTTEHATTWAAPPGSPAADHVTQEPVAVAAEPPSAWSLPPAPQATASYDPLSGSAAPDTWTPSYAGGTSSMLGGLPSSWS